MANAWDTEEPFKPGKATQNDLVFAQIRFLRNQGLDRAEVEKRLLEWAKENQIGFSEQQLKDKLDWTYRKWSIPDKS